MNTKVSNILYKNNSENQKDTEIVLTLDAVKKDLKKSLNPILRDILRIQKEIYTAAANEVIKRPALISRYDARCGEVVPIISQGTINIIQGKTGTHKSRLAELFCSLFLMNKLTCDTDFLEFQNEIGVTVVYIDTERGIKEQLPEAIQRIRIKAGYNRNSEVPNFHSFSIAKQERSNRLDAVKEILGHVQSQSKKPLFVVLDVVTDCVSSFNNETESLKLFDTLGNFADDYNATFLLLIHENPASEKARGHTGTEGQNKASTIIQIGYNCAEEENNDLMKLKFIKTRSSGRPNPIFIQYSKQVHGLVLADAETVKKQNELKKSVFANDLVIDFLESLLVEPIEAKKVYKKLELEFKLNDRIIINKISELINSKVIFDNTNGKKCFLERGKKAKDKRKIYLSLEPIDKIIQPEILN